MGFAKLRFTKDVLFQPFTRSNVMSCLFTDITVCADDGARVRARAGVGVGATVAVLRLGAIAVLRFRNVAVARLGADALPRLVSVA